MAATFSVANAGDNDVESRQSFRQHGSANATNYARHLPLSPEASRFTPEICYKVKREWTQNSLSHENSIDPVLNIVVPTINMMLLSSFLIPSVTKMPRLPLPYSAPLPLFLALAAGTTAAFQSQIPIASSEAAAAQKKFCPTYGCPLTPQDMLYTPVQQALQKLRNKSKQKLKSEATTQQVLQELQSTGDENKATLTLTGFKGGALEDQINQDRSFVISSFLGEEKGAASGATDDLQARRLMGVFDGHATDGELVSEYCLSELPKMLASKLSERLTDDLTEAQQGEVVVTALHETFVELDRTAPHGESGGCTASVMLQLGKKLYFANTGDSPTFLCVHHSSSRTTDVVYITREDKPSLPDERARVEAMGGKVWVPIGGGSSRVLFTDPVTGDQTGIAMSRSIGDRDVGKYGVIPDPTIDVIDLEELIQERMRKAASGSVMNMFSFNRPSESPVDDVHIFAVSASDGMMDILNPKGIARFLVPSLCQDSGEHLLTACEKLISTAADGWQRASFDSRYRDDIAISVCKIRTPPCAER
ncbi:serine/threonine phosphatase [Fragilaria crotonensis]|nr:serine/threonine phosphatase [Fragilaria crotonensis]